MLGFGDWLTDNVFFFLFFFLVGVRESGDSERNPDGRVFETGWDGVPTDLERPF